MYNETFSGFLKDSHLALLDLRLQKGKAVFFNHVALLREKAPWISFLEKWSCEMRETVNPDPGHLSVSACSKPCLE